MPASAPPDRRIDALYGLPLGEFTAGAQQREREAVRALARSAVAALGRSTQADRIERTLSAAALDPEARELLQAGRLTEGVAPSGFGALAGRGSARGRRGCSRARRVYVTVKCWNMIDSCGEQYALYLPATSFSVNVFVPTKPIDVNVHDLPCGPSSS